MTINPNSFETNGQRNFRKSRYDGSYLEFTGAEDVDNYVAKLELLPENLYVSSKDFGGGGDVVEKVASGRLIGAALKFLSPEDADAALKILAAE